MKFSCVSFDLDGTLARSKSPMEPKMVELMLKLIATVPVCIISGGKFEQFLNQALKFFPKDADLTNLHIMPTCGTRYYRYINGQWEMQYKNDIPDQDKKLIIASIEKHSKELGLWETKTYGDIIEDRGSQITFSALGQEAPVDLKETWDPDNSKKESLRDAVQADIPNYQVGSGGSTSIDVTKIGVDKAYGLEQLVEHTGIELEKILFIGDRLEPGGNDFSVTRLPITTVHIKNEYETMGVIEGLLL
jgi:HAD superfamily hydrolase (TIGR01484 family)